MSRETRYPEEALLDFLVGNWRSGDKTYDFQTEIPGIGRYSVHGGVAYEPRLNSYVAFAVNNLGSLLLCDGTWQRAETWVFTLSHPRRDRDTRISYTRNPDGTVLMTSQRPAGGSRTRGGGRNCWQLCQIGSPD